MIVSSQDLAECDARCQVEDLFAAQDLASKLIDERQPLLVLPFSAQPCDRIPHRRRGDYSAGDCDHGLQVGYTLHEDLQAARPSWELAIWIRHKFGVSLDPTAWKNQQA